jgi:hypothetical protein
MMRFGYGTLPEDLNGSKVHRLENVMTLEKNMHESFDRLYIWFVKVVRSVFDYNYSGYANMIMHIRRTRTIHTRSNPHIRTFIRIFPSPSHLPRRIPATIPCRLRRTSPSMLRVRRSPICRGQASILTRFAATWRRERRSAPTAALRRCWNMRCCWYAELELALPFNVAAVALVGVDAAPVVNVDYTMMPAFMVYPSRLRLSVAQFSCLSVFSVFVDRPRRDQVSFLMCICEKGCALYASVYA